MEPTIERFYIYGGYIVIMEENMETTNLGCRV